MTQPQYKAVMIVIVGAGFAGTEAAWACAQRGVPVTLYEMRPVKMTPAHQTDKFSELVCSNSFKSQDPSTPAGLLKTEMKALGSLVIPTGEANSVPGGSALAVDRELYASAITKAIEEHPLITISRKEFTAEMAEQTLTDGHDLVLATGPLTSEGLGAWLAEQAGDDHLYFYDAVSPVVTTESLDMSVIFAQSRYDKGEGDDYLNCPFNKEEYHAFVTALVEAEQVPLKEFEKPIYFESCKPIEEIAKKGQESLRFGNFKPVGLTDPRTDRRPYAALQLRPENKEKTLYSLVACQNRLKWGIQKEVLQLVPGLANAEFVRLGVIHRNTYIQAPKLLNQFLEFKSRPGLYVAGQITGVEGYVESAAIGIYVGMNLARKHKNQDLLPPPNRCAYGSLLSHLQDQTDRHFAPMNINWGLLPDPEDAPRKKDERRAKKISAAHQAFAEWSKQFND